MTTPTMMDWLKPTSSLTPMQASGHLFVIRCMPDAFTGETFNIGVCGIDPSGVRKAKVITEPGRLSCFYGDAAHNVVALAAIAKDAAEMGHESPSKQVIFDTPTPYFHSTLDDAVANTFADQVTVALPQRATSAAMMLDDEQALEAVVNAIKTASALNMELLANTPQVIINTEKGPRTMRVPLQPRNGVGTVRSAYYSASTLKTHLMDSVLDMECAARYRNKKHMGLFILRPEAASKEVVKQIDAVIDSISYRAPVHMMMEVEYDAPKLAKTIDEWAKTAQD